MQQQDQHRMGLEADAVLRLGMMLASAGSSGYRVMRAMKRAARALGFDRLDANVGITQITCTFHRGTQFRTVVALAHDPSVDASRIEALETLSHNLHRRITVEELNDELDAIENLVRKRWSPLWLSIAAGVACAAFAVLNHFSAVEAIIVALAAACGQAFRGWLARHHMHQLGSIAAAGTVASLMFYLIAGLLDLVGITHMSTIAAGYVAAVLFLIPGFPLFSSMLDLSRFDFQAGVARLAYSLTVIFTATFVVTMVSWVTSLNPKPAEVVTTNSWYFLVLGASFFGVAGFAFLFNCSRRMVIVAASVGAVANVVRFLLLAQGATQYIAAFMGGLIIGLVGAIAAKKAHLPRVTTTVPASVILIPGASMFRAVYAINQGDMNASLNYSATSGMVVASIAAGLVLARMLTDRDWTFGHVIDFGKPLDHREHHGPHHPGCPGDLGHSNGSHHPSSRHPGNPGGDSH